MLLASNDTAEAYAALQAGVLELCGTQLLQSDSVPVLRAAALLVHALASQNDQAVRALTHSVLAPPNTVMPRLIALIRGASNMGGPVEVTVLEAVLLALGSLCGGADSSIGAEPERGGTTQMQRTMSQMFASDVSALSSLIALAAGTHASSRGVSPATSAAALRLIEELSHEASVGRALLNAGALRPIVAVMQQSSSHQRESDLVAMKAFGALCKHAEPSTELLMGIDLIVRRFAAGVSAGGGRSEKLHPSSFLAICASVSRAAEVLETCMVHAQCCRVIAERGSAALIELLLEMEVRRVRTHQTTSSPQPRPSASLPLSSLQRHIASGAPCDPVALSVARSTLCILNRVAADQTQASSLTSLGAALTVASLIQRFTPSKATAPHLADAAVLRSPPALESEGPFAVLLPISVSILLALAEHHPCRVVMMETGLPMLNLLFSLISLVVRDEDCGSSSERTDSFSMTSSCGQAAAHALMCAANLTSEASSSALLVQAAAEQPLVLESLVLWLKSGNTAQQTAARLVMARLAVGGELKGGGTPLWSRLEATGNLTVALALLRDSCDQPAPRPGEQRASTLTDVERTSMRDGACECMASLCRRQGGTVAVSVLESGSLPLLLSLAPNVPTAAECIRVLCFSGGLHRVLLAPSAESAPTSAVPSRAAVEFLGSLVQMLAPNSASGRTEAPDAARALALGVLTLMCSDDNTPSAGGDAAAAPTGKCADAVRALLRALKTANVLEQCVAHVASAAVPLARSRGVVPDHAGVDGLAMEALVVLAALLEPDPSNDLADAGDIVRGAAADADGYAALEPELAASIAVALALSFTRLRVGTPARRRALRCLVRLSSQTASAARLVECGALPAMVALLQPEPHRQTDHAEQLCALTALSGVISQVSRKHLCDGAGAQASQQLLSAEMGLLPCLVSIMSVSNSSIAPPLCTRALALLSTLSNGNHSSRTTIAGDTNLLRALVQLLPTTEAPVSEAAPPYAIVMAPAARTAPLTPSLDSTTGSYQTLELVMDILANLGQVEPPRTTIAATPGLADAVISLLSASGTKSEVSVSAGVRVAAARLTSALCLTIRAPSSPDVDEDPCRSRLLTRACDAAAAALNDSVETMSEDGNAGSSWVGFLAQPSARSLPAEQVSQGASATLTATALEVLITLTALSEGARIVATSQSALPAIINTLASHIPPHDTGRDDSAFIAEGAITVLLALTQEPSFPPMLTRQYGAPARAMSTCDALLGVIACNQPGWVGAQQQALLVLCPVAAASLEMRVTLQQALESEPAHRGRLLSLAHDVDGGRRCCRLAARRLLRTLGDASAESAPWTQAPADTATAPSVSVAPPPPQEQQHGPTSVAIPPALVAAPSPSVVSAVSPGQPFPKAAQPSMDAHAMPSTPPPMPLPIDPLVDAQIKAARERQRREEMLQDEDLARRLQAEEEIPSPARGTGDDAAIARMLQVRNN